MNGHGFHVTGDPADLPPGAKIIEVNLTPTVEIAARAIYTRMQQGVPEQEAAWEDLEPHQRHNMMELGMAALMALVEAGWHSTEMHEVVAQAIAEDTPKPPTGMDPR